MGCKPSKLQIQHNGDLFNEDTDDRKKLLTGLQASKSPEGVEVNFQIAFAKSIGIWGAFEGQHAFGGGAR